MNVIIDEIVVNYEDYGSGSVILFLHGWGDTMATFSPLAKSLSEGHRVILLDLPGFGGTEEPKTVFDLQKYADFVAKFLNKIEAKNLFAIVGHSNGGAIAIKGLSTRNLTSEKLILIASSGIRSTYKGRKKALRLAAKAAKIPTSILPKRTQEKVRKKAYKTVGSDLFVAENLQESFKKVVSEDLEESAKDIHAKTLLIYGEDDTATPVDFGEKLDSSIPDSELIIIPNAGHFVHSEQYKNVLNEVNRFL